MPQPRSPSPGHSTQPRTRPPPSPTRPKRVGAEQSGSAPPAVRPRREPLSSIQAKTASVYSDANLGLSEGPTYHRDARSPTSVRFQLPPAPTPGAPTAATAADGHRFIAASTDYVTRRKSVREARPTSVGAAQTRQASSAIGASSSGRVGPFRFVRTLNNGAFGVAYVAHDTGTGRVLCARVVEKKKMLADASILRGLLVEALCHKAIASSCAQDRTHLTQLHGVLQDEKQVLFVMPLMHCDLLAVIRGRCDRHLTRRWIAQLALGVDALHRMGIIHRDIKPENVLLDAPDGNARIADFNAAYAIPWNAPLEDGAVYTREVTGSIPYMAWEMTEKRWYGKMVDWWSLGCLMFDLVTGTLLFKNDAARSKYVNWDRKAEGLSYLSWRADMSDEEESVISGLIGVNPCARFQLRYLRQRAYFLDEHRANVFDVLLREAPSDLLSGRFNVHAATVRPPLILLLSGAVERSARISHLDTEDRLKDKPLSHATFQAADAGHTHALPEDYDFSTFAWVNPRSDMWSS
ncbi:hypothetical protein BN946_scf184353.g7 [Trametes cinnabarina]|uniref:non-specific serine/threonine protein kinase n=1 Tax=Pycnoporus cinnabarinus TaxID=5643 RepID=A0A060SKZ9_PYCCI|nr:hypothetical protein BN946_scf184353.g7 [Trametes cinnabarina]